MWFHVDGAYAGNACICPEYRPHLNGIEKADSFNMNPHKWLPTNFDCSTLWVQNRTLLQAALGIYPVYLRNKLSDNGLVVDYKDWQIPLGRRFRALKLWMVMRMYGSSGLQSYICNHCDLAKHFEKLLRTDSRFEVMAPRMFSLVCFRLRPPPNDADNGYALNAMLADALNSDGSILVTNTIRILLPACFLDSLTMCCSLLHEILIPHCLIDGRMRSCCAGSGRSLHYSVCYWWIANAVAACRVCLESYSVASLQVSCGLMERVWITSSLVGMIPSRLTRGSSIEFLAS
ncbi:hypothetical protein M758_1G019700 [Ceratodon purpureus]|nr:hypothetical protein M758_1G019700 [Ceratodon purpureus]